VWNRYLTCGFADLSRRVGVCSALTPKTIISYLDSAKRLEAYLAAEGLPLEPPGIRAFLVAERDRAGVTLPGALAPGIG